MSIEKNNENENYFVLDFSLVHMKLGLQRGTDMIQKTKNIDLE